MVNQTEQPAEANDTPVDTGNTTTDITEEFAGVDTFDDVSTSPEDVTATEPSSSEGQEGTNASPSPSTAPLVTGEAPPVEQPGGLENRMAQLEQQNAQYQRSQYESALNEQYTKYRTDLENNGYLPDQAEHVARTWLCSVRARSGGCR